MSSLEFGPDSPLLKCVNGMEAVFCPPANHYPELPISFRALPELVKSLWQFVRIYDTDINHWELRLTDENMLIFMRCVMRIAEVKVLQAHHHCKDLAYFHCKTLPYPIALYVDSIGKFKVHYLELEVFPVLVQHRIRKASGAINYSLTDLITLMNEFQHFRSVNDEIVAVARSISDLPGVEWVEEHDMIKLSASTLSSWTMPNVDDWRTFQKIIYKMRCFESRGLVCFLRNVDVKCDQGSPVQAVRFPDPYNLDRETSYYINIEIPTVLEKLAPFLMLGYEHGGDVKCSWFCGASDALKRGRAIAVEAQNMMFWVHNPEYWKGTGKGARASLLNSVKKLPLMSCMVPSVRIPISFRALPKIVKEVWNHANRRDLNAWGFHRQPKDPRSFQIFLRCVMYLAEIKLAYAQTDTKMNVDLLQHFYGLRYCMVKLGIVKLPYPIATFINHIGKFKIQNQTVIPELIQHEMKSASGVINFSLSAVITLISACSEFLNVDSPIVEMAKSAFEDLIAEVGEPLVEWEPHPNDKMLVRISEASAAAWTLPSEDDVSKFNTILNNMRCIREKSFLWETNLATGLGSSVQAIRFPQRLVFHDDFRMYRNIPVPPYEEKLAPALMLGYEQNGRIFSRFCSSGPFSGTYSGYVNFSNSFSNIMQSNEENRDPYYPSSDESD